MENIVFRINSKRKVKELLREKKAVCFGTGYQAHKLLSDNIINSDDISFFIDSNKDGFFEFNGKQIPIYPPNILAESMADEYFIIISSTMFAEEMIVQVNEMKACDGMKWEVFVAPILDINSTESKSGKEWLDELSDIYLQKLKDEESEVGIYKKRDGRREEEIILPRVAHIITNCCTLNCKNCCNLIPKQKKRWHDQMDSIVADVENLLSLVDRVVCYELIGGEVFIHSQIDKILEFLCKQNKIEKIEVTTNGTIIPSEEIIELLQNDKIVVRINEYHVGEKAQRLFARLKENRVMCTYIDDLTWWECHIGENHEKTRQDIEEELEICGIYGICKVVQRGYIYHCGAAVVLDDLYGDKLGIKNLAMRLECVTAENIQTKRKQLFDLYNKRYIPMCNYCNFGGGIWCREVKAGEQIMC